MNVTSDEMKNAGDRLEYLYLTEAYPTRLDRTIRVDSTGYVQWSGQYWSYRQKGDDHETAIQKVEQTIRDIWHNQQIADGVIPPDPEPPIPDKPPRAGAVRFTTRALTDDHGPFLGLGFSFFWAPRAFRNYPDRFDANMKWGQRHGFNYYRALVTTGGWPPPDGWEDAGAFMPWALEILPAWLDAGWHDYGLRCSLTLFDGQHQFPTFDEQDRYVRDVCAIIAQRRHTVQDVQIANEYGPCEWLQDPEGIDKLRAHARTVRECLGPGIPLSISAANAKMYDSNYDEACAEARALYDGLLPDIVTCTVHHDSREMSMIDGPWRHVRQGWERVLHDTYGNALEPDCSIDDEPAGPRSSVNEEVDVSRLVQKALVDFVSGRCAYTFHPDSGIWSSLRNPPCAGTPLMGCFDLIEQMPSCNEFAAAMTKILAVLPPDLPNWPRTSHHWSQPPHPFAKSFTLAADGQHWTQIWPDQVTDYGVVRSFTAVNGNQWVAPLTGIRDRIDMKWEWALEGDIYTCKDGEKVGNLTSSMRTLTIRDSVDTDILIIGRWV